MPGIAERGLARELAEAKNFKALAVRAGGDPELVKRLLAAVSSPAPKVRFGAAKVLRMVSESDPDVLYPGFDFFARLLRNGNSVLRWNAILILGNLARADKDDRLDGILDEYLRLLIGPQLIDAGNTIKGATAIALAKPRLADAIAGRIMEVERAAYATRECRNVAIGHALGALDAISSLLANQRAVEFFAARQLLNSRPATRRKAEKFLRKRRPAKRDI